MIDRLLDLLALDSLPRTGWLQAGLRDVESIGAHSHGVCLLALLLGSEVRPALDVDRVVTLCAVHDAPEALLGDLPRTGSSLLPEGAKSEAERAAAERLLGPADGIPGARFEEYAADTSREARFARLCDKLHLGLRAFGYRRAGARSLESFRASLAALDCAEFEPAHRVRAALLERWAQLDPSG